MTKLELFFKLGFVYIIPKGEQDLTQLEVIIHKMIHYFTGCDEMGDYFATEADTMIEIVCEVKISFEYYRKYVIKLLFITSVTQAHGHDYDS